jgi:predicted ABC-type ATPase
MPEKNKRLRIMAGPNGSGKSTVLKAVRKLFYSGPFVNADEIEKALANGKILNPFSEYNLHVADGDFTTYLAGPGKSWVEKAVKEKSAITLNCSNGILFVKESPSPYDAALAADFIRNQLLLSSQTFTFETVLSHPSKIDFLRQSMAAGYKNYLYFICTVSPAINIDRIKQRTQLGGHSVPEDRIIKRYFESLQILSEIIPLCYRTYLFDNSLEERSIEPVAEIDSSGTLLLKKDEMPWWIQEYIIDRLYKK